MVTPWAESSTSTLVVRLRLLILLFSLLIPACSGIEDPRRQIARLRQETEDLFYHGFDNYMTHAFPEDELRPVTCQPLTRDTANPHHVEVNDALGNYSLTLVDSLSTLAILASTPTTDSARDHLSNFQHAVRNLVDLYGDGTLGPGGTGKRARGFDLDSKVQVFETVIRGVGGLLSAHLFAVGDLPIRGYSPPAEQVAQAKIWNQSTDGSQENGIHWSNGLVYNGQLLRLAYDLGQRLLPAFWTSTGLPYPRVNLRHGIPFYATSANNYDPQSGQCDVEGPERSGETTETCSAGAGSLVLEFTVLSRLTGDARFEDLSKRAFWTVWSKRSDINLIGGGIDAETGVWTHTWTGIGAGIDSFFEYAYKTSILLSESEELIDHKQYISDPRQLHSALTAYEQSPAAFMHVWTTAHDAIKRHIHRGPNFQHDHYIQVELSTGAGRAFWVDALSAYYPGLLTLAGLVEEATVAHMLYAALWQRFAGVPERYNMVSGGVEGGLNWWIGRPEFIESNWYLYRATEDPWHIHVAEMVLRDIQDRCWTDCGWAGIQNVLTGQKVDRMESFFLGETAKYLYLTFDPDHPLNKLDGPFVFSTEGHPLIIPRSSRSGRHSGLSQVHLQSCPARPAINPFIPSQIAARKDLFHAASLARLHLMPTVDDVGTTTTEYAQDHRSLQRNNTDSPSNYIYLPWTLPPELVPRDATSSPMPSHPTFDLTFPMVGTLLGNQSPLQRVKGGYLMNGISGVHISMIQDVPRVFMDKEQLVYRVQTINHMGLGRDEKIFISRNMAFSSLNAADPLFSRSSDSVLADLVIDTKLTSMHEPTAAANQSTTDANAGLALPDLATINIDSKNGLSALISQISNLVRETSNFIVHNAGSEESVTSDLATRQLVPAITATGLGAAPVPDWPDIASDLGTVPSATDLTKDLPWNTVYDAGTLCDERLKSSIPRMHQIILVKRGGCSFSQKMSRIPSIAPGGRSLQLVIVVDMEEGTSGDSLVRPLLEERQTTPTGLLRPRGIPMVMVGGGESTYDMIRGAAGLGLRRRWSISCQGVPIDNIVII